MKFIQFTNLVLLFVFTLGAEAKDPRYTIRLNTPTNLTKLYPIDISRANGEYKNYSIGGLAKFSAFNVSGFRLALDYSSYNIKQHSAKVKYEASLLNVSLGKEFLAYEEWFDAYLGFEIKCIAPINHLLFTSTDTNYTYSSFRHGGYTDSTNAYIESAETHRPWVFGLGVFLDIERKIVRDVYFGVGVSLSLLRVRQKYVTFYRDARANATSSIQHVSGYSIKKRKYVLDPVIRCYLRF